MADFTAEVIRAFRNILYRDSYYVISGILIIAYVGYFFFGLDRNYFEHLSGVALFTFIGLSLAIGFANQEAWSQTGLVTTTIYRQQYPRLCVWMYQRHTRQIWVDRTSIYIQNNLDVQGNYLRRVVDLQHIASSLASCNLTLAALSLFGYLSRKCALALPLLHIFCFCLFVSVCWVKTMQHAELRLLPKPLEPTPSKVVTSD